MEVEVIYILDLVGVVAFAVSGALTAMRRRMDPFGVLIIAFVTAIGGGTLRDMLIGVPVAWVRDMNYVYIIIGTTALAIIFRNKLAYLRQTLSFFDTIGLATFTLIGLEKALEAGFAPAICIITGTMTGCFGGIIRDILANKIPIIFQKEIYATACILGGLFYFALRDFFPDGVVFITTGLVVFGVRSLAVFYDLHLPSIYKKRRSLR